MTTLISRVPRKGAVIMALAAVLALATLISGCGASTASPVGNVTPSPTPAPFHALVVAAPMLGTDSHSTSTTVRVMDPATGKQLWSQELNGYPNLLAPAIANGVVAVSIGIPGQPYPSAEVAAFDAHTGAALWRNVLPGNTQAFISAAGSSLIMTTSPVSVEAEGALPSVTVTSLKPADGTQLWQRVLPNLEPFAPVVYSDETVFVSAAQVGSQPIRYLLTAFNGATGTQLWQQPIGTGAMLSSVASSGRVFVSMYAGHPIVQTRPAGPLALPVALALDPPASPLEGTLTAYRASDGKQLWQVHGFTTAQSVVGGALYATDIAPQSTGGTAQADFTVVAYDSATGAVLWRSSTLASADPFVSKPFVAADAHAAYVFGIPEATPSVHALTAVTGARLWNALPSTVAHGAVAGLGKVFVGAAPSTPAGQPPVMQTSVTIYALDAASGSTAWKLTIDNCIGAQLALV